MTHRRARTLGRGFAAAVLLCAGLAAQSRELSFDQRVEAQRSIERVLYAHRIGTGLAFDEAMPPESLANKVRTYLQESAALAELWNRPVTGEMLASEQRRILSRTRMPQRLREIEEALGGDDFLFRECFVRPVLVRRLTRSFFASDTAIHASAREQAEALHGDLASGRLPADDPHVLRRVHRVTRQANESGVSRGSEVTNFEVWRARAPQERGAAGALREGPAGFEFRVLLDDGPDHFEVAIYTVEKTPWDEFWRRKSTMLDWRDVGPVASSDPLPDDPRVAAAAGSANVWTPQPPGLEGSAVPSAHAGHTAVWTGTEMIVWGGLGLLDSGGLYDPLTDSWSLIETTNAPKGRFDHRAVWTGTEMIVWGGFDGTLLNSGARYTPGNPGTWTPLTLTGAPGARRAHSAVWTGAEMIVWGGEVSTGPTNGGAAYDPATDSWSATTTNMAPAGRAEHTAVWTGTEMIVWGGRSGLPLEDGGRYDPAANSWSAVSAADAPTRRFGHSAVWTGTEMIVWGGRDLGFVLATGGRYDPAADSWVETEKPGAPMSREHHRAVWTGDPMNPGVGEMIVWGGRDLDLDPLSSGGRYDPAAGAWSATAQSAAPLPREHHSAVWTGTEMIVWGGSGPQVFDDGGRYDPVTDSWVATAVSLVPSHRQGHSAVWTGTEMIVWGGFNGGPLGSGGVYDPLTGNWSTVNPVNAPAARNRHTAVWTGGEMIVWGGTPITGEGGRYDPGLDQWQPMTLTDAPAPRFDHTAVWSGTQMIVWGGFSGDFLNSGGRYNPANDRWTATNKESAPTRRSNHTAVWTGDPMNPGVGEMIVWGGSDGGALDSGARYRPQSDTWSPTRLPLAPSPRQSHTAVWTGTEMIVWGGRDILPLDTGGAYDPAFGFRGLWTPLATAGAPAARSGHTAVWTGSAMIVWGGFGDAPLDSGGVFDPAAMNPWGATDATDAPAPRSSHSAIWSGNQMVVWGGFGAAFLNDGGIYGPAGPTRALPDAAPRSAKTRFTREPGLAPPPRR